MAEKLNVTVSEWVFKKIVENRPIKSRSEWVEELIIKGFEVLKMSDKGIQVSNYQNKQSKTIFKSSGRGNIYIEPIHLLALKRVREREIEIH